ncbi:hypothetical protein GYMLUDRAFT_342131 [Collybiopsis luxurians FD-317 M1]|nr:hypothetical protein GYMLUDRAFT_342131 [Collybiopsis luxurians FD-317 M1]
MWIVASLSPVSECPSVLWRYFNRVWRRRIRTRKRGRQCISAFCFVVLRLLRMMSCNGASTRRFSARTGREGMGMGGGAPIDSLIH